MEIDTLVMVIADQNGGKSNQMRTIFEEQELFDVYGGYPTQNNIARRYLVPPDAELLLRLSSWHERGETYNQAKTDIASGRLELRRRYKVFVPAQVTATNKLMAGEELFMKLMTDFEVRRGFAVWLSPDVSGRTPFSVSATFAAFMSTRRQVSAVSMDSLTLKPSAAPKTNSINARMFCDMLFRS